MNVKIRPAAASDTEVCGRIIYDAFKGIADRHRFPPAFPSLEAAPVLGFTLLPAGFALPAGGSVGGVPIRYTRGLYPQTPRREDPDFRERAQGGAEASDCTLLRDSRAWPLLRR